MSDAPTKPSGSAGSDSESFLSSLPAPLRDPLVQGLAAALAVGLLIVLYLLVSRPTPYVPKPLAGAGAAADSDAAPSVKGLHKVKFETTLGDFVVELDGDKAPVTVGNFLKYVDDKHYDGTIFHRVINNFMIQGGGFTPDLREKPTRAPIKNESGNGLTNVTYSIAMARTQALNSATAQFYINVKDNPFLDQGKYAVFGKVIEGTQTIDKIKAVNTHAPPNPQNGQPMEAVPTEPVIIKSATRL
jgi:peptidyl-prolyl cis-trans isomerase A (cyclophilin A)